MAFHEIKYFHIFASHVIYNTLAIKRRTVTIIGGYLSDARSLQGVPASLGDMAFVMRWVTSA